MALIGSIEQFKLSGVLGRLETHKKTGLLIIQQGGTWVELYFREGSLMCIGPVRTSASLGERLLQENVISRQAWQETQLALGADNLDEVHIAITLINLGHTTKEHLRSWSMQKVIDVLQILLTWHSGDIYFEEDASTPPGRLLAAFSISSLLAMMPQLETPSTTQPSTRTVQQRFKQAQSDAPIPMPQTDIARFKTLMGASYSPLEGDSPVQPSVPQPALTNKPQPTHPEHTAFSAGSLVDPASFSPSSRQASKSDSQALSFQASEAISQTLSAQSIFDADLMPSSFDVQPTPITGPMSNPAGDAISFASVFAEDSPSMPFFANQAANSNTFADPQQITIPMQTRYIDTSYMSPNMILMPLDLSALYEQNTSVALTPDQWRLLTRVDGRTSLQTACVELSMSPDLLCQVAGELAADKLISLAPSNGEPHEISPMTRDLTPPVVNNSYGIPGYPTPTASVPLSNDIAPQFPTAISFEARSQWGNGGNGAAFVPGRGWVAPPQPPQQLSPGNGPLSYAGYAQTGGNRQ